MCLREPQPPFRFYNITPQWWLREPQPQRTTAQAPFRLASRASATETTGNESLRHQNHRDREPQPPRTTAQAPFRLASRASATKTTGNESLRHQNHRDREPQPPFRLASRASATKNDSAATENESLRH